MTENSGQKTDSSIRRTARLWLVLLVVVSICFQALPLMAGDNGPESEKERAARIFKQRKDKRLLDIQKALDKGEEAEAADLLYQYFRRYRDDEEAEDALWRSLKLQRDLAHQAREPDWD